MDYTTVKMDEIKQMPDTQLKQARDDVRKQLAEIRMDVYSAAAVHTGKVRKLRKTLARLSTVQTLKKKNKL